MNITVEKFYSEPVHLGQRIAGEVSYRDIGAAAEMGQLVERLMQCAGEDPSSPRWQRTVRELHTTLSLLGAPHGGGR